MRLCILFQRTVGHLVFVHATGSMSTTQTHSLLLSQKANGSFVPHAHLQDSDRIRTII